MKLTFPIMLLLALIISSNSPSALAHDSVADFSLQDFRGKRHRLSDYDDSKVVVLAFLGTECPLVKLYGVRLQEISKKYDRGVTFLGINSNRQDSITEIAAYTTRHGITFPVLKDVGNHLADRVKAKRTPTIVVLDANRKIRFRGPVDDQYGIGYARDKPTQSFLEDALNALLADKPPAVASIPTVGCLIGRVRTVDEQSKVTYGSHIASILNKHCVQCHRDGEIAPFALTSYDEVAGWSEMIREVIQERRMPPWHANPAHGQFSNARGLSKQEKDLINQWVDAGAPAGDLTDLPELPKKAESWQLETPPDHIVRMPRAFDVPAEGTVKYKYFEVDPGFTEDKWVRASQVVPGSRDVVHHILVFAREAGSRRKAAGAGGGQFLAAYVPGQRTAMLPKGMAKLVPAGSKIVFQMHYTPNGVAQSDRSSVGFYFADGEDIDHAVVTMEATKRKFTIPPHDPNYQVESRSARSSGSVRLLSFMPHMHLRGKSFRYNVELPGGKVETLLDIPEYDFNWQTSYRLQKPREFPAGSRLHCVAHFDNSKSNLNNPDPSASVSWGDQTWHEMMIGYFDIAMPRAAAESHQTELEKAFAQFDKDGNGKIQKSEVEKQHLAIFRRLDANKDNELDLAEFALLKQR